MTPLIAPAFALALVLALCDWYVVATHNRRLEYFFKPATLLVLIAIAAVLALSQPGWLPPFFVAGLVFSLAGDVFLMLPDQQRNFIRGLIAFLLGHVCYIVGLNPSLPPAPALIVLAVVAVIGALLLRGVVAGLRAGGRGRLAGPVILYGVVLSLMLFSAWATLFRPEWPGVGRALAVAGGTLFFASDAMLAWDRFVTPIPGRHLPVMVTYHLAQVALTATILFAP